MGIDEVIISKDEYAGLLDALILLSCLEDAGVDNWSGYSEAMKNYVEIMSEGRDLNV